MTRSVRRWSRIPLLAFTAGILAAGCAPRDPVPEGPPVVYPRPPDAPRMQFLTAINASWDVVPKRIGLAGLVFSARDEPEETDVLKKPYGIAVHEGRIYVCDQRGADVKVFDVKNGTFSLLSGDSRILAAPNNLCVTEAGYKFVVEAMRHQIHVFDPQDEFVTTFVLKDSRPADVVAVGDELFVPDVTGDRVLVLDRSTGKQKRVLGETGKEPGQFLMPNAIARDAEGFLYVCDQMNYRWQKIDRNGKPLLAIGGPGDSYGHFARPRGIAVGPDGVVYVVETLFGVVQMFNQEGEVLMGFGHHRGSRGFVELPAGITTDTSCLPYFRKYVDPRFQPQYLVFVVSQVGSTRVGVYAFGELKEGEEMRAVPVAAGSEKPPRQPEETQEDEETQGDEEDKKDRHVPTSLLPER